MTPRAFNASLLFLLITLLAIGCGGGGSSGTSLSSGWLGVTDPNSNGKLQIEIEPSSVSIKPEQKISLAVLVKDAYGHPLDGVNVLFSSQLGGKFDDESSETKKGRVANFFTAGKKQGTESIVVTAKDTWASKSLLVQSVPGGVPVVQITTSADTTLAGNPVTVTVGASIDGTSANDLNVSLSSTFNGKFGDDNGKIENGWYTTNFTPDNLTSGIGTITAMINGVKVEKSLWVVKEKISSPILAISVNPNSIFQGQTAVVIVIAKDETGAPSRAEVSLSASLSGSFKDQSGEPKEGIFFTEFTAGNEVGNTTITVNSGTSSASTILSIEKPEIVMKIAPVKNSVKINEIISASLLVTDTYSRPIDNAKIFLTADLGCDCVPGEGTTNSDGYFFFEFTASKTVGISNIYALTAGATATAQISVVGP